MMFFTFGSGFTPRCTACDTTFIVMLTDTLLAPGIVLSALMVSRRRPSICDLAG